MARRIRMLAVCVLAFAALAGAGAHAAGINVTYDALDLIACDGDCDVDGQGHCSLRAAVSEALCFANGGAAGVSLPSGMTFSLTIGPLSVSGDFTFSGSGSAIVGPGTFQAILGDDGVGVYGIAFQGFTTAVVAVTRVDLGDAVFSYVGRAVSTPGTISANRVSVSMAGEGLFVTGGGMLSVGDSTFVGLTGTAISASGGGAASVGSSVFDGNDRGVYAEGDLSVHDSQFRFQTGQAISSGGQVVVSDSILEGNGSGIGAGAGASCTRVTFTNQQGTALDAGGDVVIAGSTFSDGHAGAVDVVGRVQASGSSFLRNIGAYSGGAISATEGISLTDCLVQDNQAETGGGLYIEPLQAGSGSLYLASTSVFGNVAHHDRGGGGIRVLGAVSIEIVNSQILSNAAPAGAGGGLFLEGGRQSLSLSNTLVTGNTAELGGGLYIHAAGAAPPALSLDRVIVRQNSASVAVGGIYSAGPALTMVDSEVSENVSVGAGGGVFLDSNGSGISGTAVFERSLFYLNHSDGEGAAIYGKAKAGLQLLTSTVSTNTGPTTKGAITVPDLSYGQTTPPIVIEASSIVGNSGIGVKVDAAGFMNRFVPIVSLRSSLFADNAASCGNPVYELLLDRVYTFRRIADDGFVLDQGSSCALYDPTSFTGVDPRVGALADNGGATRTHALASESPAIDAGDPVLIDLDQRGQPRVGAAPDIGACEAPPTPPTVLSVTPSQGSSAGGTRITVRGRALVGASVSVGGVACTAVAVVNATELACTTGAAPLGVVDVSVTNGANLSGTLASAYTYIVPPPPPPQILGVTPASGPTLGGTVLSVQGTEFASGAVVSVDGAALATTFISASELRVTTPPHAAGTVGIAVDNPDGQRGTLASAFTYVSLPFMTSLSPTHGPAAGNTTVTITGENFLYGASVAIDGVGISSTRVNTTTIMFVTPPHAPGPVSVIVANPVDLFAPQSLTYVYDPPPSIASVSPNRGPSAGGTQVRILGALFTPTSQVRFGGVLAASTYVSAGELQAIAPAYATGWIDARVDVVVTNPDGQTATAAAAFTYAPPPNLIGVSPAQGLASGGFVVQLTGNNFKSGATASFGGASVPISYAYDFYPYYYVTAPAHAAGLVDVVVTNPDGQTSTLSGGFTYLPLPTVTNVVDRRGNRSGPTTGGTKVTITGTGFDPGAIPSFGGVAGTSVVVVSATSITCFTPAHAAGVVDVTVRNPNGGIGTLSGGWTYAKSRK